MAVYTGYKPQSLRSTTVYKTIDGRKAGHLLSSIVPIGLSDPTRNYLWDTKNHRGTKVLQVQATDVHIAGHTYGTPVVKVLKGVATVGIGYVPCVQTPETEQKPIRRWPRDWHGDNIK